MSNSTAILVFESAGAFLVFGGGPQGPAGPAGTGSSSGDVVGPASSVDNTLARFNGTTGKLLQGGALVLDDAGNLTGVRSIVITNDDGQSVTLSVARLNGRNTLVW